MKRPTYDEAHEHAPVQLDDGRTGFAGWYPQMGGYSGLCVAVQDGGCWDVHVWHDGEFPFGDDDTDRWGEPRKPVEMHHCDPGQFVQFGKWLESLETEGE